ncbi:aLK and LTK ligand 2a [Gouania willdenowi]|uniref:ALK and LTK ligand 2-like n=1 Tax=Gouania willdenowi TaxID=441366 RepID=A0A8C5HP91_GOUWI|nr:ALK and LTK ligand 2-like [Gouania willdenowi]XP_028295740.1 ALK and LTK ligand 2-like [Gouania willdenowi]
MGALRALRTHFAVGLVLLLFMLTGHCSHCAPSPAPAVDVEVDVDVEGGVDVKVDVRRMVELVKHVEKSRGHHGVKTPALGASRQRTVEQKQLRTVKTERGTQAAVGFPRDLRKKEKFLVYLTGPLYFSPKCRKNAYRLYHHTRDCTIPAYFKRCARLLTRLAGSPQCTEG